jgi:polyisoprenyl-phosphate glycosyltransferase
MSELSIVLPCYNESGNINTILKRFFPLAQRLRLELILVDNGSTDRSAEIFAPELRKPEFSFAKGVRVEKNIGYGYGIQFGLKHCQSQTVGYSHADLQTPPEDIERAFKLYQEQGPGPRLVKGRRTRRSTADEAFVSKVYNGLGQRILGVPYLDLNAQPKIFDQALVADILKGPRDFSFDLHVLHTAARRGCRLIEFDVNFEPRTYGQSKWASRPLSKVKTILTCFYRMLEMRAGRYSIGR